MCLCGEKLKKVVRMRKKVWYSLYLLLDIGIVLLSFAIVAWFRNGTRRVLVDYAKPVLGLSLAWVTSGLICGKFTISNKPRLRTLWSSIIKCDAIAISIVFGAIIFFHKFQYSRYITFATIGLTVIIELLALSLLYYSFKFHKDNPSFAKTTIITKSKKLEEEGSTYEIGKFDSSDKVPASPFKVDKNYCLDTDTGTKYLMNYHCFVLPAVANCFLFIAFRYSASLILSIKTRNQNHEITRNQERPMSDSFSLPAFYHSFSLHLLYIKR